MSWIQYCRHELFVAFTGALVVVTLSGCALVTKIKSQPTTSQQVLTILSDAQWGVSAAHDQLWLSDTDYTYAEQVLAGAVDAVSASGSGYAAVAKMALLDVEAALPADSRLRPYFDAAVILL